MYAKFPLVQQRGDVVAKIIKPFNLNQAEPMGIYDHGSSWRMRVQRLRRRNLLPSDVLFAVRGPAQSDGKRYAAFQEVCSELRGKVSCWPTKWRRTASRHSLRTDPANF